MAVPLHVLAPEAVTHNPFVEACIGRQANEQCTLALGSDDFVGLCTTSFVPYTKTLLCIAAEVLYAQEPCQAKTPGEACEVELTSELLFPGVCAHDAAASGQLGCVTQHGALFLSALEKSSHQYVPSVLASATLGPDQGSEAVQVRRHGGSSLCLPLAAESSKLPFHVTRLQQKQAAWILLPAAFVDDSMIRTHLGATLMRRAGLIAPKTSFVRLSVNGRYLGLYTLVQDMSALQVAAHLQSNFTAKHAVPATLLGQEWMQVTRIWDARPEDHILSVAMKDSLILLNRTSEVWYLVQDAATGVTGYAAADGLQSTGHHVTCAQCVGRLYEPITSLVLLHPHQFVPLDQFDLQPEWSADAQELWAIVHANDRRTQASQWRQRLEAVLDVEQFLTWLAMNSLMNNWDTYGHVPHNFRLYSRPKQCVAGQSKLSWLPLDFDHTLDFYHNVPMDIRRVRPDWPLIHAVAHDAIYFRVYQEKARELLSTIFSPALVLEIKTWLAALALHVEDEDEELTNLDPEDFERGGNRLVRNLEARLEQARRAFLPSESQPQPTTRRFEL